MAKQRNALKAGSFIMVSIVLIFVIVISIRGLGKFLERGQVRYAQFALQDDLGGLRVGDDVRIGGFRVGEVTKIEIVAADDERLQPTTQPASLLAIAPATQPATQPATPPLAILVTFGLPGKYHLKDDAIVRIQTSVTGQSCLNFETIGQSGEETVSKALVGRPGTLTTVLATLTEVAPRLNSILTQVNDKTVPSVNAILDDVHTKTVPTVNDTVLSYRKTADAATGFIEELRSYLKPVIDKYHAVAASAVAMMDEVKSLVGETKGDFRGTIANLNAATGSVKEKLPDVLDKVSKALTDVDAAIANANTALEDVKKTVANTRDMTASAKEIVVGNKSKIDGMIASLKATSDNLKNASVEIRHSPWRLLYKPEPGEVANLNLFDSAREFADGANELNDAAQALRDATKAGQTDPEQLKKLMEQVDRSFKNFTEVEQKLWKEVKE